MMLIFTVSLSYGNIELLWLIDVIYFPNSYVSLIIPILWYECTILYGTYFSYAHTVQTVILKIHTCRTTGSPPGTGLEQVQRSILNSKLSPGCFEAKFRIF
jgi:hypothetical protein